MNPRILRSATAAARVLALAALFGSLAPRVATGRPETAPVQDVSPLSPLELVSASDPSLPTSATASSGGFPQLATRGALTQDGRWCVFASRSKDILPNVANGVDHAYVRDVTNGTTVLLDRSDLGVPGNSSAFQPSITPDGHYVIFATRSNLIALDTNGTDDVYVRDLISGSLKLVSVNSAGSASGNSFSGSPSLTPDGRYAVFASAAGDLAPPLLPSGNQNIYLRDLQTGTTSRISINRLGTGGGNNASFSPSVSDDGRFVAYESAASDLVDNDTNNQNDVFVRDRSTNTTILASATPQGNPGNDRSNGAQMGGDGRYVFFNSWASNLCPDSNGQMDLFVFDTSTGTVAPITADQSGTTTASGSLNSWNISPEGRVVSFSGTYTNMLPGIPTAFHLYHKNLSTGQLRLLSTRDDGVPVPLSGFITVSVSSGGTFVVYATNSPTFFPGDTNNTEDLVLRDVNAAKNYLVSARNGSPIPGNGQSYQGVLSPNGGRVAFYSSASDLVANDFNKDRDLFARDLTTGVTVAVTAPSVAATSSSTPNGFSLASQSVSGVSMSADGRFAVFISDAANVHPGVVPAPALKCAYVRDFQSGLLIPAVLDATRAISFNPSEITISPDGQLVAFTTSTGIPGNTESNNFQVYVSDRSHSSSYLVTKSLDGTTSGNQSSRNLSFSADGRFLFFLSSATNLVSGGGFSQDLFVHDLTQRSTLRATGVPGVTLNNGNGVFAYSVSGNGRFVTFATPANNLHPQDTNGLNDVFVRDLQLNITTLVSATPNGIPGAGDSSNNSISSDGRYVAFQSTAPNILPGDTNGKFDVFVRDLQSGTTVLASTTGTAPSGNGDSYFISLSPDGRFVLFSSTASNFGPNVTTGTYNLYLRDLQLQVTHLVSLDITGTRMGNQGVNFDGRMSPDGRYVLFGSSSSNLVPETMVSSPNIFIRDTKQGKTFLVSRSMTSGKSGNSSAQAPELSADGTRILFGSPASDLIPNDQNNFTDVFTCRVSSNRPPLADAGADKIFEASSPAGTPVTFDGTHSIDPDGQPLLYNWFIKNNAGVPVAVGSSALLNVTLPPDIYLGTLTVTDPFGATGSIQVKYSIRDTKAPRLWRPLDVNRDGIADDTDGDGIPDADDPDADGDGIPNELDNAPYIANADQADADGDGIGDVEDAQPTIPNAQYGPLLFRIYAEQTSAAGTPVTLPKPQVQDAADAAPTVTHNAPAVFPLGDTKVVFVAKDAPGNLAVAYAQVIVYDSKPPVFTETPAPVVVEQTALAGTPLTLPFPAVQDVCDANLHRLSDAPAVFPLGTTLVTFTATDTSGNTARISTTVTVTDRTPPSFPDATSTSPVTFFVSDATPTVWGGTNRIFRYVLSPAGVPTLDGEISDPSGVVLNNGYGLAFGPDDALWVANRRTGPDGLGRVLNPRLAATPEGVPVAGDFRNPHDLAFHGDEVFVTNYEGRNVLRFRVDAAGALTPHGEIPLTDNPYGIVFSPWGELFVSLDNQAQVARFLFLADGTAVPNGFFSAPEMSHPQGMAFSPAQELFVANRLGDTVSRFRFDAAHEVIPNGFLSGNGLVVPSGVAFGPGGELFIANHYPGNENVAVVSRWTFDAQGLASPRGTFPTPSLYLGGIVFAPPVARLPQLVLEKEMPSGTSIGKVHARVEDLCDASVDLVVAGPAMLPPGSTWIRHTATDDSGNRTVALQEVLVRDTIAPSLINVPGPITVEQGGPNGTTVTIPTPTATDQGGDVTVVVIAPPIFPPGVTIVTFIATDGAGNITTATTTVTVVDTTPPSFSARPSDLSGGLLAYWPFDTDARDVGPGHRDLTLHGGASLTGGRRGAALGFSGPGQYADRPGDDPDFNFAGDFSIQTWIYLNTLDRIQVFLEKFQGDDGPGWTWYLTGRQTWEFVGMTNPQVVVFNPQAGSLQTGTWYHLVVRRRGQVYELLQDGQILYSATDSGPIQPTSFPLLLGRRNTGNLYPDFDGRLDELAIWNRALSDNEVRLLASGSSPELVVEQAGLAGTPVALQPPPAWDAVTTAPTITIQGPAIYPLGPSTVTVVARDDAGNSGSTTLQVRVVDTTPPQFTSVPAPQIVEQASAAGTAVPLAAPAVVDLCDAAPHVASDAPAVFPLGRTVVTFTATDASGNVATATTTVDVRDTTPPTLTLPSSPPAPSGGVSVLAGPVINPTNGHSYFVVHGPGWLEMETYASGVLGGHLATINDPAENSWIYGQFIGYADGLAFGLTDAGSEGVWRWVSGAPVTFFNWAPGEPNNESNAEHYAHMWRWNAYWNDSPSAGSTYGVVELDAPWRPALVVEQSSLAGATALLPTPVASDVCDAQVDVTHNAPEVFPLGTTIVTFTARDDSGNEATAQLRVTVRDTMAPVVGSAPPAGLAAWWRAEGDGIDSSGGRNGTLPPGMTFAPGKVGQAFSFDGTSGYIEIPDEEAFDFGNSAFSLAVWVKTNGHLGFNAHLLSKSDGWGSDNDYVLWIGHTTGVVGFEFVSPTLETLAGTTRVDDGAWHFIAVTHDGPAGFLKLYVDGALQGTLPGRSLANGSAPLRLGSWMTDYLYRGLLDELQVYRRALTASELTALYTGVSFGAAPIVLEQGGPGATPAALPRPAFWDVCDANVAITLEAPAAFPLGTTIVTWRATDASGNTALLMQSVNLVDTTPPVFVDVIPTLTIDESNYAGTPVTLALPHALDLGDAAPKVTGAVPSTFPIGTTIVTWKATDASGNISTATTSVTIVNRAPVVQNLALQTNEDVALPIPLPVSDAPGTPLTIQILQAPVRGTLSGTFPNLLYTPFLNQFGTDTFRYTASDGRAVSATATVTITVAPVNDAPVARDDSYTTTKNKLLTVLASGVLGNDSDVDSSTLTASVVTGPAHALTFNFNGANGSFTYTPAANFTGTDTFTYQAKDGLLASAPATVTITVNSSAQLPVAQNDSYSSPEDQALHVSAPGVLANDTSGNPITAQLVSTPGMGTLTLNPDGSFDYVPQPNYSGVAIFKYKAFDGTVASNIVMVTLNITSVNDAPVAVNDVYKVRAGKTLSQSANGGLLNNDSDVDNTAVQLKVVNVTPPPASAGTLSVSADGSFTFTASSQFTGTSFTYQVSDGTSVSNVATVAINLQ